MKDSDVSYELKLICLTPSLTFQDILNKKPYSLILTSGTMAPLDAWQK